MVWLVGFKGWRMEGSLLATFAAQIALIAASLALSFGFVAGARRDIFGYSLSALYAGSALAYSGGSLPIEGAPTVARVRQNCGWPGCAPLRRTRTGCPASAPRSRFRR